MGQHTGDDSDMHIQVNGKQIDIGDALRQHVEGRLTERVFKYFDRPVDSQVTFARDGYEFRADCAVHLSTGMNLLTHGKSTDIYGSFDVAIEKLEKRLRRYKRRLKDHHSRAGNAPTFEATSYVIAGAGEQEEEPEPMQPVIIAEETAHLRTCTVGEAVMQMDLAEAPAVVFRNSGHGRLNVVYRRPDGHVGWIDPAPDA
ncbi:MAG: ribosome hibernation-promoting factor, HPF/YfiA family [Alphaproteobacteria bacterium]